MKLPCVVVLAGLLAGGAACSKDPATRKQEHLTKADAYRAQGKYHEAEIEYANVLLLDTRSGPTRVKLAETFMFDDEPGKATLEYSRAADLMPDDVGVQLKAGAMLLLVGDSQDAVARAQAALAKDPKNVSAMILEGRALAKLQDFGGALRELSDAIDVNPHETLAYSTLGFIQSARGDLPRAETAFRKAIEVAPGTAEPQLALGDFLWSTQRVRAAEDAFRQVLAVNPRNLEANRRMILLSVLAGRLDDAERFARVVSEDGAGEDRVALAQFYLITGRVKDARALLETLAAKYSDKAGDEATLMLTTLDLSSGALPEALKRLEPLLARQPHHARANVLKARILAAEGDLDPALEAARVATASDPHLADGFSVLGHILVAQNKVNDAVASFSEALKQNPRSTEAMVELLQLNLKTGGAGSALQFARAAVKGDPGNAFARLLFVQALGRHGDFEDAQGEIKALEAQLPNSALVQAEKGELALGMKDPAGAERAFARALALNPASMEALAGLTAIDVMNQRAASARARLDAQLTRVPGNTEVLMLAAQFEMQQGNFSAAEVRLRRLVEIAPQSIEAYRFLGQSLLKQNKLDQARAELENHVKRDPRSVGSRTAIGVIYELSNDQEAARREYEATLQVDPHAAIAANNLAWIYVERGENLDAAVRLAQGAQAQLPNRPEIADTLGMAYFKKNLIQFAIPQLQDAVAKAPSVASYHLHLGLALAKTKDLEEARKQLELALKLNPKVEGADDAKRLLAGLKMLGAPAA